MGRLPSGALSILVLPNTYSTPLRPLPSSPGRISPDSGPADYWAFLSCAPASPTAMGTAWQQGSFETSVEAFMVFAGRHEVPMHYSASDLEEDRRTLERLSP